MMNLFLTNTQLFVSQARLDWCTGVVWIINVFISCLESHSDGTHSLQRIHWWASDVMLHFSKCVLMKEQTHLLLGWPEGEYIYIFGWTIPLNCSISKLFKWRSSVTAVIPARVVLLSCQWAHFLWRRPSPQMGDDTAENPSPVRPAPHWKGPQEPQPVNKSQPAALQSQGSPGTAWTP